MVIPTDNEVIESVLSGNSSDYKFIVNKYKNRAFSLINSILKNEFDSEEVLQDCFIRAYKSLSQFKGKSTFSTWFYRIVYNTTITKVQNKRRKLEREFLSIDERGDKIAVDNTNYRNEKDLNITLNLIIKKLPDKYSTVITLFYMEKMNYIEISKIMDVSLANVKITLHRARLLLREIIFKNNYDKELQ